MSYQSWAWKRALLKTNRARLCRPKSDSVLWSNCARARLTLPLRSKLSWTSSHGTKGSEAYHQRFSNLSIRRGFYERIHPFLDFPFRQGQKREHYVARAVEMIWESDLKFKLGPMDTSIEGEWEEGSDGSWWNLSDIDQSKLGFSEKWDWQRAYEMGVSYFGGGNDKERFALQPPLTWPSEVVGGCKRLGGSYVVLPTKNFFWVNF